MQFHSRLVEEVEPPCLAGGGPLLGERHRLVENTAGEGAWEARLPVVSIRDVILFPLLKPKRDLRRRHGL